jgi:hypothetical protein
VPSICDDAYVQQLCAVASSDLDNYTDESIATVGRNICADLRAGKTSRVVAVNLRRFPATNPLSRNAAVELGSATRASQTPVAANCMTSGCFRGIERADNHIG